jgi:hypothetical protein
MTTVWDEDAKSGPLTRHLARIRCEFVTKRCTALTPTSNNFWAPFIAENSPFCSYTARLSGQNAVVTPLIDLAQMKCVWRRLHVTQRYRRIQAGVYHVYNPY